ncbi:succinate dehydrogenase assembly factor 4, mitochondrial-like [Anthonomus grandis grandis]|uniref:succinate dehydrogenase assembly factor 4, mitochondrial-like n=1 Tax=Anthonomus grandis grandis TaxID=2921223 RepID=UPI0021654AAC|nr:succinate dehydrogenase assembly factor 4, mitochondrial-like [Anthonomus grandis grandis]XP_050310177.1 succinate dehydrogenase assembly factor 4, mitochondrial-like [Anthonomus grandis grandis]
MTILRYILGHSKNLNKNFFLTPGLENVCVRLFSDKKISPRMQEFKNKLREKTPIGRLDELSKHPDEEEDPLKPWPDNTNPHTGEIGGPKGPEPTRYGDWERKGRVTDF